MLSNHLHLVVTDTQGLVPEFMRWLFEHTAKCINASLGRWENLWSTEPPSLVRLESADVAIEKILYCMANPTQASLVLKAAQWPGLVTLPHDYLRGPLEVERPPVFFRSDGPMPPTVKLQVVPPPGLELPTTEAFVDLLTRKLEEREVEIRGTHKGEGRPVMGPKAVQAQDPFSYPEGMEPRRNLKPQVAAANKWLRMEARARVKDFVRDHAAALAAYLAGDHQVEFPAGTYWMVRYAGARAASPG